METGKPFSMTFVAFDRARKKGGQIKRVHSAILENANRPKLPSKNKTSATNPKKNPNHWDNQTRAFRHLVDGVPSAGIRKFHIFLLTEFNGEPVYL